MNKPKVVITGMGVISPIGNDVRTFWSNLVLGKSGVRNVTSIDTTMHRTRNGAEVKDFDPRRFITSRHVESYGRATQYAIAATKMALTEAGLDEQVLKSALSAVVIGTTMANIQDLESVNKEWVRRGEEGLDLESIYKYPSNNLALGIAAELKIKPLCFVIPTACSAGNYCIGYGYDLIRNGQADYVICGGADSFSRIAFTGFNSLHAMAPEKCQPFDKHRKGMILGEGAGILLLENASFAKRRNVEPLAEIIGYGLSCDASSMTLPDVDGVERALRKALLESGLVADNVDYISAHGTGTKANDSTECKAVNRIFGNRRVPMSSIKSMLGHTMGAASAIEAISCVLAIQHSTLPPTINFEIPDQECEIDCVPNTARRQKVRCALNNSFAFGGNNACLVIAQHNRSL